MEKINVLHDELYGGFKNDQLQQKNLLNSKQLFVFGNENFPDLEESRLNISIQKDNNIKYLKFKLSFSGDKRNILFHSFSSLYNQDLSFLNSNYKHDDKYVIVSTINLEDENIEEIMKYTFRYFEILTQHTIINIDEFIMHYVNKKFNKILDEK